MLLMPTACCSELELTSTDRYQWIIVTAPTTYWAPDWTFLCHCYSPIKNAMFLFPFINVNGMRELVQLSIACKLWNVHYPCLVSDFHYASTEAYSVTSTLLPRAKWFCLWLLYWNYINFKGGYWWKLLLRQSCLNAKQ